VQRFWVVLLLAGALAPCPGQTGDNVLLVVNRSSNVSRRIGEHYARRRSVPQANVCVIQAPASEHIDREVYQKSIETPVGECLKSRGLQERVLYIVTTLGVPLKVIGDDSGKMDTEACAVDSELALLYGKLRGEKFPWNGFVPNPMYQQTNRPFRRPQFPIYLATRLAGYDFDDVRVLIDRSLQAENRGKFVFDLRSSERGVGNDWLRAAAARLPPGRVLIDESDRVLYQQREVIGYAGWGSNDGNRKRRLLGFQWLPGAIATEFVSTNGRTFQRPPPGWNITTWDNRKGWFAGAPQTLTADYINEGASGCSGHVDEPFLEMTARPETLFPAYFSGRNLAESYYLSMPVLSWQNIVVGDPLCRIGPPK